MSLGLNRRAALWHVRGWASVAAALAATAAQADGWDGSVGVASDKVFRGVSQSDGKAAVLLDLRRQSDTGWTLWLGLAGPAYQAQGGTADLTLALAKGWQLAPDWSLQLGATHYQYLGSERARAYSYNEFGAVVGWQGRVLASFAFSPDTSRVREGGLRTDRALVYELTLHERLAGRLALDAGLGYYDLRAIRDVGYVYRSLGLSWGRGPVQAYLSYIDSRAAEHGLVPTSRAGERWVASVLWSF